jgi:serine/threonine-protein kinase
MGVVYRAHQLMLDRQVAVKLLRPQYTEDERAVGRFLREARALARVEHPHAVAVHDTGVLAGGVAYLVMEYVEGESLRALLGRAGPLPLAPALAIAEQVCAAVEAAHRQGVVHRDLKPENVMLKPVDGGAVVKVVDFGLAKIVGAGEQGADGHHVTAAGEFFGTPAYMAPEFCHGNEIDGRADVYAIGVLLYEMLAGAPPFRGTLEAVLSGHLYKEPPRLGHAVGGVPAAVEDAVRAALRKRRADRPGSAADLAGLLRGARPGGVADRVPLHVSAKAALAGDAYPTDAPTARSLSSLITLPPVRPAGSETRAGEALTNAAPPETMPGIEAGTRFDGGAGAEFNSGSRRGRAARATALVVACAISGVLLAGYDGPGGRSRGPAAVPAAPAAAAPERVAAAPEMTPAAPAPPPPELEPSTPAPRARPAPRAARTAVQAEGARPAAEGKADAARADEKRDAGKGKKRRWFDPRKWF